MDASTYVRRLVYLAHTGLVRYAHVERLDEQGSTLPVHVPIGPPVGDATELFRTGTWGLTPKGKGQHKLSWELNVTTL